MGWVIGNEQERCHAQDYSRPEEDNDLRSMSSFGNGKNPLTAQISQPLFWLFQKRRYKIHWERKYDGGILVCADNR